MIKITFEYRTVEEATVALAKLGGLLHNSESAAPPIPVMPVTAIPAEAKRRGRPPKNAAAPENASLPKETAKATAPVAAAPETAAPPQVNVGVQATGESQQADRKTGAAAPTLDDLQKGIELVFNQKQVEVCMGLLSRFGAKRVRDLKPEQYAEFAEKVQSTLDGSYDPLRG